MESSSDEGNAEYGPSLIKKQRSGKAISEDLRIRINYCLLANVQFTQLLRLTMRQKRMRKLIADRYDGLADWKSEWKKSNPDSHNIIQLLGNPLPGHQLPRREWVVLNRLRTGHGRCKELLHKWKMADLPDCDCGHLSQTIHHIIKDCPFRAFKGSMRELHHATDEAINWIKALDIIL
ncbi:hypothetical protein QTP88_019566 [Uroleucon formosanum]